MSSKNFQPPTEEEIARYAYYLWESEGRIHGRDLDYWLQAEAHLNTTREYEAGLLNSAPLKQQPEETPRALATPSATRATNRSMRKRSARVAREPEPAFA